MEQKSNDKANEKMFKTICNFVNDLADCFAVNIHSLALYDRLLTKTTMEHKEAVDKNITLFRDFILKNKTTIIDRTPRFSDMVRYSEKVFLDMNVVINLKMDNDTRDAIWKHLSVLLVMFDPETKSQVIKTSAIGSTLVVDETCEEDQFLNKIISRVSEHVTEVGDPKAGLTDVLSSGLIPELVNDITSRMGNGTFDLGKMIASVEKLAGGAMSLDPQARNMLGMLSNMRGLGGQS